MKKLKYVFLALCIILAGVFIVYKIHDVKEETYLEEFEVFQSEDSAGIPTSLDEKAIYKAYKGIKNREDKIDLSKYNVDAKQIYRYVSYHYPEFFYLDDSYRYDEDTLYPDYNDYTDENVEEFQKKIKEVIDSIDKDYTTEQKIIFIHDYIVTHTTYNIEKSNAYEALINHESNCTGYSLLFKAFMDALGIPSEVVLSEKRNHSWNIISFQNQYYYIDCTHDDPIGMYKDYCSHECFLLTQKEMYQYNIHHQSTDWTLPDGTNAYKLKTGKSRQKHWIYKMYSAVPMMHTTAVYNNSEKVYYYDFKKNTNTYLMNTTKKWYAYLSGGYYKNYYTSFTHDNENYYMSDAMHIYKIHDKESEVVFTLKDNMMRQYGCIYNISYDNDKIYYDLLKNPEYLDYTYKGELILS